MSLSREMQSAGEAKGLHNNAELATPTLAHIPSGSSLAMEDRKERLRPSLLDRLCCNGLVDRRSFNR